MKLCLLIATIGLTVASHAATTYYVAPTATGNGSSSGAPTNLTTAFLNSIATNHSDTNTVIALDGLYSAGTGIAIENKGSNIVIRAANRWGAIIANGTGGSPNIGANAASAYLSSYITFDGLCISNSTANDGITISHHCIVRNCWIIKNYLNGINSSDANCSNNLIEYNLIEQNGQHGGALVHGAYVSGGNNIARYNVVRNDVAGFGLHFYTGAGHPSENNNTIHNNLTYGNTGAYGLTVWSADGDTGINPGTNIVYGNTILDGMQVAYGGLRVTNNIIIGGVNLSGGHTVASWQSGNNLSTASLGTYAGPGDVISSMANVGWVNTNTALYWLGATSTARGAADNTVYAPVDFFGSSQSSIADIGFNQYSNAYASDTRDLSGVGANFWLGLTNAAPAAITNSIFGTVLRIGP